MRKESTEKDCYIIGDHRFQEFKSDRQVNFPPVIISIILFFFSCELDLEDVISEYEFATINSIIMQPDGSVIMCINKSELLHILDELSSHDHKEEPESLSFEHTVLVIVRVCIINEVISTAHPKTWKELAEVFYYND